MHICNCISQYGMGLVQTANKCYWPHFVFFLVFLCHFYVGTTPFCGMDQCSSAASPKFWGIQKLEWAKFFYFRLTTVFCLEYRLSKHKMTRYSKNLRGTCPLGSPGNAYGPVFVLLIIAFFYNQQVAFLRWDKFENIFWIVCDSRFFFGKVPVNLGNGENAIWLKCLWLLTVLVT